MSIWTNKFKHPIDYLLLESLSFCLLETGSKIILEQTGASEVMWTNRDKN